MKTADKIKNAKLDNRSLLSILLTCDGKGKKAKALALRELLKDPFNARFDLFLFEEEAK